MIVCKEVLTTAVLILSLVFRIKASEFISACYYTSWSATNPNTNIRLPIDKIDAGMCTHIIYSFGKFDTDSLKLVPSNPRTENSISGKPGLYAQFNALKKRNSNLRTLLSVGGQHYKPEDFALVAKDPTTIAKLAKSSAEFLRKLGFDGLDVDWEHPDSSTKAMFVGLLKGIREVFDQEAKESGQRRLLLTVAVPAGEHFVTPGYDVPEISKYVDYIFLMSYDYAGSWNELASFNSPLKKRSDPRFAVANNVEYSVDLWLNLGAPKNKLVVGMTGAGAVLTLNSTEKHGVGDVVIKGGGRAGNLFMSKGRLIYPEICMNLNSGWTRVWDAEQLVPYAYQGNQWVGYDDKDSIKEKVQYIMRQKLAGSMFWELSFDDPLGKYCNDGAFPLLHVVYKLFGFDGETPLTENVDKNVVVMTKGRSGATTRYNSKPICIVISVFVCASVNFILSFFS